jgi:hypothetical protein
MAEGKLSLQVLDVHGRNVEEPVDIFLRNQTLSHAPAFRSLDVRNACEITDLNVFPNGTYRLEIDALSYQTVSRFVNIPPDGNATTVIPLPVNPKKVLRVEFPPFGDPGIPSCAWELLNRSPNVLNFSGRTGKELYESLDDIRKAGFLNLVAKANRTRFHFEQGEPQTVLSFIHEISELRGDRFLAMAPAELRSATTHSVHEELFREVSEALHTPPPGFVHDRSFKTLDHFGNLQLSFFASSDGRLAVDMDIDDAQGFDHIFQVVGNFWGGPTHPYNIHEILIASQELDPRYELIVREVPSAPTPTA